LNPVTVGFAPTRRSIFSAPDAVKFANLTRDKLSELSLSFVDINDINDEGLLYDEKDMERIIAKFKTARVAGLFVPHCNFGTEYLVAKLAKELKVPVLLWGPRDEAPDENGIRLRDSQCGLFATGKVLRRFNVPFTYMTNCRLDDPEFKRGINDFYAMCNVVRTFRNIRILQIAPRPYDFLSTMCNEGELLERFNVHIAPIPMPELIAETRVVCDAEVDECVTYCKNNFDVKVTDKQLNAVARLKCAVKNLAAKYKCQAVALQCWNALQGELGIMPCVANALLNDEGLPVVCETDIHGAISTLLAEAAAMGTHKSFFADWTVRHPFNENGELLQHCGPWPKSTLRDKPVIGTPLAFEHAGAVEGEAIHDVLTLCRFDGDNGEYSLLLGNAKTVEGPYTKGTYVWIEVENLKRLEAKLVEGPYIHHVTGIHKDVVPILYEACKYMGVKPDLYDENDKEIKAYLRGE
jgi:L-fucose isomerase-like protein